MNKHRSCAETSAEIMSCGVQSENGRVGAQVPHSLISAELTSTIPVFRVRCATVGAHLAHVAPPRGETACPTGPPDSGARCLPTSSFLQVSRNSPSH